MRRDDLNEAVSFSSPGGEIARTSSVKRRLTLRRKMAGDNSMSRARQKGTSTYAPVCQLTPIWSRLHCLNPSRAVMGRTRAFTVLLGPYGGPV